MCRRVVCRTCGKFGHAGCGMHVDQVLAGVPRSERCGCGKESRQGGGWLGRLFGRR